MSEEEAYIIPNVAWLVGWSVCGIFFSIEVMHKGVHLKSKFEGGKCLRPKLILHLRLFSLLSLLYCTYISMHSARYISGSCLIKDLEDKHPLLTNKVGHRGTYGDC